MEGEVKEREVDEWEEEGEEEIEEDLDESMIDPMLRELGKQNAIKALALGGG